MDRYLPPNHPLNRVHRIGAALFGLGLVVFGALGFANQLAYFSTSGDMVLGLSSNGLLSTISVVVGLGLVVAAVIGGLVASTTTSVVGAAFLLSGLVNLAVLDSPLNLLAFKLPNVLFSLVAGMLLLFVGLYGRVAGRLPQDNPYWRARHHEEPYDDHSPELLAERARMAEIDELAHAELAVAEGHATAEQLRMVHEDAVRRAIETRRELYRREREQGRTWLAQNSPYS
ncbi:DUF4383 domain-containing protein [Solihabitans fulvus]|uniref:DUF4383 domain-containing protein n=2 Tax=Solihabitans fulvus TaxID=1892852 RepID=A0A5B2WTB3_9PSEU|nr:DUF4383 domain-containing protein [Solihabitans fulvus]